MLSIKKFNAKIRKVYIINEIILGRILHLKYTLHDVDSISFSSLAHKILILKKNNVGSPEVTSFFLFMNF